MLQNTISPHIDITLGSGSGSSSSSKQVKVFTNASIPANPSLGIIYINTDTDKEYIYDAETNALVPVVPEHLEFSVVNNTFRQPLENLDLASLTGLTLVGGTHDITTSTAIKLNDITLQVSEYTVLSSTTIKFAYELLVGSKITFIKD